MHSALNDFIDSLKKIGLLEIISQTPGDLSAAMKNIGEFQRTIELILRPRNKAEVIKIVEVANKAKISLHPYSRGCNWGYGSKLPPGNAKVLLNLSLMDRILLLDEEMGIVTIEPGVSQKQIADELLRLGSKFHIDVTGSGRNTSVLGNALERGVAYQGLRVEQVVGLEVLLGNGTVLRTGFGEFPNPVLAGLYSHGQGPSLDGLFFQSNLGIVLEAKIRLQKNSAALHTLSLSVNDSLLAPLVDTLAELLRDDCLHGIPHIADRERLISTLAPLICDQEPLTSAESRALLMRVIPGDWTLTAAVIGTSAVANEKLREVLRALKKFGRTYVNSQTSSAWKKIIEQMLIKLFASREEQIVINASKELRGLHSGQPTNAGVRFLQSQPNATLDRGELGFLLATPLAPLRGESAELFRDLTRKIAERHKVKFAMTLNLVSDYVLEAVVSAHFTKNQANEITNAHAFINELNYEFSARGLYAYRINIDQMRDLRAPDTGLNKTIENIRKTLDPNGVISPGRYH